MRSYFLFVLFLFFICSLNAKNNIELYVSPEGSDLNEGTLEAPFQTIQKARDHIRAIKGDMDGDIFVYLRGGNFFITSPLLFTEQDAANNGFRIHYKAYKDERPVINGAVKVEGWKKHKGNIYKAPLDRSVKLRQLYVGGKRCQMAKGKSVNHQNGFPWGEFKIEGHEEWADTAGVEPAGALFKGGFLKCYKNPDLVELHSKSGFAYHIVGIDSIRKVEDGYVAIFQQPIGAVATRIKNISCSLFVNELGPQREFHFENAMELLDEPGEFYFNPQEKTLYYYKRVGEDLSKMDVYAPVSEGLMFIQGKSKTNRVSGLEFSGIVFEYEHWGLEKLQGSYGRTAEQSITTNTRYTKTGVVHADKYASLRNQRSAICVENAENIKFYNNIFRHIGSMGIDLRNDVVNAEVVRNDFNDVGGAAINVGEGRHVYIGDGDIAVDREGVVSDVMIAENDIKSCGVEYWAAPGISVIYGRNIDISHNNVVDIAYSGISIGWGWVEFSGGYDRPISTTNKNINVVYNFLENTCNNMHDGAAIYTLGLLPGSEITGNYIVGGGGAGIYLDQGTAFLTVKKNVCVGKKDNWFYIWGKQACVRNVSIIENYTDRLNGNETINAIDSYETGTTNVWNSGFQEIVEFAGVKGKNR